MPDTSLRVKLDRPLARALAGRLGAIEPRTIHFLPRPSEPRGERYLVEFYMAWVGICQQTRNLEGTVDGVRFRGSDYLAHRLRAALDAAPERFSAASLARVEPKDLASWLSDDGEAQHSTVDRLDERVALLRGLGEGLASRYGGLGANVLAASKGRLRGRGGLYERLARFHAYRDPARKKSFLLVLFLRELGIFEPVDPKNLGLPVDYHILRVFLRSGALRLIGPRSEALLAGEPMTPEEDLVLRRMATLLGRTMSRVLPLEKLDLILWMLGRNCCHAIHPAVCRTGPCTLAPGCSFRSSTSLECGLACPLAGVCRGSLDAKWAAFLEPSFDTDLY